MKLTDFIHQKLYEKLEYKLRRDPITLVPVVFGFIVLLAMPIGMFWLIKNLFPQFLDGPNSYPILILCASIFILSAALFFYTYFINFYLDLLIITNDRLLHIRQLGLFARTVSEVDLYRIQDVSSEIKGFFPSLFNYGNLLIQTAGAVDKFMVINIPDPEHLRQAILNLAEDDRKYHAKM